MGRIVLLEMRSRHRGAATEGGSACSRSDQTGPAWRQQHGVCETLSSRPVPEQQQLNSRARLYFKTISSSNEFGYLTDFYATGLMPQGKAP